MAITIENYLKDLIKQKENLVSTLQDCGVEASKDEMFNTLVPKVADAYEAGKASGGNTEEAFEAGKQAEYDRFWDSYQQNGNRTEYIGAFSGSGWNSETFKPKYKPIVPKGGNAEKMFSRFTLKTTDKRTSITPEIVDFSQCTSMQYTFQDSTFDTVIADLSNATTLYGTFNMGNGISYGIRSITLKVTEKCTSFNVAFAYAYNMEELFFTEDSIISANLSVKESNKLPHDSLMSIINALKDYSGTTTTRTLTLHATSKALLTDTEKAIATQKGWTIA